MNGYQFASLLVGVLGGGFLLTASQQNKSNMLRFIALGWIAVWCIPPLVILWVKSVFS